MADLNILGIHLHTIEMVYLFYTKLKQNCQHDIKKETCAKHGQKHSTDSYIVHSKVVCKRIPKRNHKIPQDVVSSLLLLVLCT